MSLQSRKNVFIDFDISMVPNPSTKDIYSITDDAAIRNDMRNILLIKLQSRGFEPYFGSNVSLNLFEPNDSIASAFLDKEIIRTLQTFCTRILVMSVNTNILDNGINIDVTYKYNPRYNASTTTQTASFFISRG